MQYLDAVSKMTMISVHFQGKLFNITIIQVYASTSNAEEAEVEWFYEDLKELLEVTHTKRCPFGHRGLECKSRKSRDTWSNRQVWPWSTKWSRAKEFCQENALVIAFLPRGKHLLISWLQSPSAVILEPKKRKSVTVSIVFPSIWKHWCWSWIFNILITWWEDWKKSWCWERLKAKGEEGDRRWND